VYMQYVYTQSVHDREKVPERLQSEARQEKSVPLVERTRPLVHRYGPEAEEVLRRKGVKETSVKAKVYRTSI